MRIRLQSVVIFLPLFGWAFALPEWGSLAGLLEQEIQDFAHTVKVTGAHPPPGPDPDPVSKLVNDAAHPWKAPGPNDIRGPCPALNTLASHGYLNRNGIVTPQEVVTAVQTGFNMANGLAVFSAWGGFIVDGNHLTNLMSIGQKSPKTGPDPPAPAIVGGLSTHRVFEGDASSTRGDFYFGDNHSFNETLFDQFVASSNAYGGGYYNATVAAEVRWNRIVDSKTRNPTFSFTNPRYTAACTDAIFPFRFFVDGRNQSGQLDLATARSIFQNGQFPPDFHRRNGSFGLNEIGPDLAALSMAHPIAPGHNEGAGNYVLNPEDPGIDLCYLYHKHVNVTLASLYPNPKGLLRKALQKNVVTFYNSLGDPNCTQVFPFGK